MRATIVSTLPFGFESDRKPGLFPGIFNIPVAPRGGYSITIIPDCIEVQLVPLRNEPIRTIISGVEVAKSIVGDYLSACMGATTTPNFDGTIPVPGIFVLEGELTAVTIEKEHKDKVVQALANTKAWFARLIILADDEWSKNHQRKLILDLQHIACSYLNLEREWHVDNLTADSSNCPACITAVNPLAVICPKCNCILDKVKFAAMKFANA